jgi:3-dehydroquinate synthase class II
MRPFTASAFQFDHDWQIGEFLSVLNQEQRHTATKIKVQYDNVVVEEDRWDLISLTGLQLVVVTDFLECEI